MSFFIQKYLDSFYIIDKSQMGNYGIYIKLNKDDYSPPIDGSNLLEELNILFLIDLDSAKSEVDKWVGNIDLTFFWLNSFDIFKKYIKII